MIEYIRKLVNQIIEFFATLPPVKKVAAVVTGLVIISVFVGLFMWAGDKTYRPLMTNLNPEDSSRIISFLRERNVPFKVSDGGKSISIQPEKVHDLRLELATLGLPESSTVGYELFDKLPLGTTTFVQQVNEKRAREGELMRTIITIDGVKRARVHLAIPKKSPFLEDQKKPSASVVLDLEMGTRLSEKQIYGIGNLVASAVEGLEVEDVVIVNNKGKTLSKNIRDPVVALSATQLDFKTSLEGEMIKRIEGALSRVVGEGKVVARVNADLNFSVTSEVQTVYDPDSTAVLSSQVHAENMNQNRPGPYGPAGVVANDPENQQPPQRQDIRTNTDKNRTVTNYKVPQTIKKTRKPTGQVTKLTVAVMVDQKTVNSKGEDGREIASAQDWTPEEIKKFEEIVSNAIGLDQKRGDILTVKSIPFVETNLDSAAAFLQEQDSKAWWLSILEVLGVITACLVFMHYVARPFIKWLIENTTDGVDTFLPQTIEEIEKMQKNQALPGLEDTVPELPEKIDPEKVEGEMIKEKIVTLIDSSPHKAALIMREWIRGKKEEESKKDQSA